MANVHQTKSLLIAEMRRVLDLLHQQDITKPFNDNGWQSVNKAHSELLVKLRELRRDSIRFEKECREAHAERERQETERFIQQQKNARRQPDA